jgi:hypothetical protein
VVAVEAAVVAVAVATITTEVVAGRATKAPAPQIAHARPLLWAAVRV